MPVDLNVPSFIANVSDVGCCEMRLDLIRPAIGFVGQRRAARIAERSKRAGVSFVSMRFSGFPFELRTLHYRPRHGLRAGGSGVSGDGIGMDLDQPRRLADATALVDVIEDAGFSAKDLKRPGVQEALRVLREGDAKALVVAKLDRLSRSMAGPAK